MARNQRMVICRKCNTPMAEKAKVCPACGAKNKKPRGKMGCFVVLIVIVALGALAINGPVEMNELLADGKFSIPESTRQESAELAGADADDKLIAETDKPQEKESVSTKAPSPTDEPEPEATEESGLVDGMRPEFKEAMDSYEAFYDEYCDFMKKYEQNPSDLSLLTKYASMLSKAADMSEKFDAWEEEDMNSAELKYYAEVSARVMTKLAKVAY